MERLKALLFGIWKVFQWFCVGCVSIPAEISVAVHGRQQEQMYWKGVNVGYEETLKKIASMNREQRREFIRNAVKAYKNTEDVPIIKGKP